VQADDDPGESGRHDACFARPREEEHVLARPASDPVERQTREHRERPRDEDQRGEHDRGRDEVVDDRLPRREVRAERDEDEHHHDIRGRRCEHAQLGLVPLVQRQAELARVPDDQPGEERADIPAAADEIDRDVAARDHGQDGDRVRLAPDAGAPARHRRG
jgi:hypothetical protein